ncbi:DUF2125 domain-containing protein [Yoonia maritima]|uniref:DUF2125 domain-containing protein n=1 Tax=Yoonia maritima TaxID=1435347 RepID=UPI003736F8CA
MTYSMKMRSAVCIAALVAGSTAHADVSAQQVWDDWKEQMSLYQQTEIEVGSEEMSGDTLVISNLSVTNTSPEMTANYSIEEIRFEEQRNGSVVITMSESYPITFKPNSDAVVTLETTQAGLEMVVSGDADAMEYAVEADSIGIALVDVVDGDITFTGDAKLVMNDVSGSYSTSETEIRNIAYEMDVATIDILLDIVVPGGKGEYVTGGGKIEDIQMDGSIMMPLEGDFETPEDMFENGFAIEGGYSLAGASYIFDVNAEGDQAAGSISMGSAELRGQINSDVISYDTTANDVSLNITGSEIPFPIELSIAEYGVGLEMPITQSEEAQDFRLSLDFIDLTINEMIWGMIDPGNVLPRDPATFQFALAGTGTPMINMMDQEQQEMVKGNELPFELNTLSLENLKIALAGALVTGAGDFTFDPTDTQTFAPMPRPEGEVAIKVNGLNQLIDNLIAMGLIPEEQAMGPRMMMGMFARTTGDDQLESTLEVNSEGHVLVNGQRVK